MARTVEDVMTRDVVSVREDTPFKDIAALMHEHRVSGVPVVGDDGRLVGIVTEADLLMAEEEHEPRRRRSFVEWFIHPKRLQEIEGRAEDVRARDIMTRKVVTVRPGTTVREAMKVLLDAGVKRLPVVDDDGRVVGIVSRGDLLAPFLRPDEEIEQEIRDQVVVRTMWMDPETIEVSVSRGVVRLAGRVERRSERDILVEFVHRVDGVVGVEADDLTFEWDDREVEAPPPHDAPARGEEWTRRDPR